VCCRCTWAHPPPDAPPPQNPKPVTLPPQCQVGIKGEKGALEHAKATGHQNFAEY
jgi:hypothetical protein